MIEARHALDHELASHSRWMDGRNRKQEEAEYREEWYPEQCGRCEFWVPLAGKWGLDWGGCSNLRSPFDAMIRFEHDGCEQYSAAVDWGQPEDFSELEA
jgi:Protein of unknown function (DUF3027)